MTTARIAAIRARLDNYHAVILPVVLEHDPAMGTAFLFGLRELSGWLDDLLATQAARTDRTAFIDSLRQLLAHEDLVMAIVEDGSILTELLDAADLLTTQAERIAQLEQQVQELTKATRGDGERLSDTTGSTAASGKG